MNLREAAIPGYRNSYLHTDKRAPGAEAFWRSIAEPIHTEGHTLH